MPASGEVTHLKLEVAKLRKQLLEGQGLGQQQGSEAAGTAQLAAGHEQAARASSGGGGGAGLKAAAQTMGQNQQGQQAAHALSR